MMRRQDRLVGARCEERQPGFLPYGLKQAM